MKYRTSVLSNYTRHQLIDGTIISTFICPKNTRSFSVISLWSKIDYNVGTSILTVLQFQLYINEDEGDESKRHLCHQECHLHTYPFFSCISKQKIAT